MNDLGNQWAMQKFAVGQPVPRTEDPRLLRGQGRYTDDINRPGQAYAAIVRSRYAHGIVRTLDLSAAREMPGVLGAYIAADLAAYGTLKCISVLTNRDGSPMRKPARPALAGDRVRFVGDPVAFVVAETAAQAKDAAEAVSLEIDPLPAVVDARAAAQPGAPQLFEDVPNNIAIDYYSGDREKTAAAFAQAAHVERLKLANSRIVVNPLEPRAAIGEYEPASGRWTLHSASQGVFGMRGMLAGILNAPVDKVRVLTGNVGGSFGMKAGVFPEYVCLLHAARALGRPVKWTDERSESFLSDLHGRDQDVDGELALDAEGRFLAVRITGYANAGAFLSAIGPLPQTMNIGKNIVSVYRTPLIEVAIKQVFTNTSAIGPYRGAGRPEANYFMERLIDNAARAMGIDRLELRRRNHIQPGQMPYATPSATTYDSGDFPALFEQAVKLSDWDGFAARKAASRTRGKLRGMGMSDFLEVTAPPAKEMGGIRFEADGTVTIITGTLDYGQGHAAPFAQVLSDRLGIPFERIRLLQGDSDELLAGGGTGGSKSMMASGNAIVVASRKVVDLGKEAAGFFLEAATADIEFAAGRFTIAGTDRGIGIMELAERLRGAKMLPEGVPRTLDVKHVDDGVAATYPNGCHVAEVEVDPETGVTEVVRYTMVNDFGTVINPLIVAGQVHGGIVQGIGQALYENTVYSDDGQLLTGSFTDYALPRADNLPGFEFVSHPVPATTNALGVKGCGEAGCAGSFPAVMNALVDALAELGIAHIDMPATPLRVWQAIQDARRP